MEVKEAIVKRRSIRKFTDKPVEQSDLDDLVESARMAPTGSNMQPLEFVTVRENLEEFFSATKWAGFIDWNPRKEEMPRGYIVILSNKDIRKEPLTDVGIAGGYIALAAEEKGLASCLLGALDRVKIREMLLIPDSHDIELVVALGYPGQESFTEDVKEDIKYWMDEQGNMHVPKRKLEDISHKEKFGG